MLGVPAVHRRGAATYPRAASRYPAGFLFLSQFNSHLFLFQVEIQKFTVASGQTEQTIRIQKSCQHLIIGRSSTLAIMAVGLAAGLPEILTAEITHPVRETAEQFDRIPLVIPALWAQYGRGPLAEQAQYAGLIGSAQFGSLPALTAEPKSQIFVECCIFLNDLGPLELLSDDQFQLTIRNLLPGATYTISAPEMPIIPAYANQYFKYEQSLILENDRDRVIYLKGVQGLFLPNVGEDTISRLKVNWITDHETGATREEELTMRELVTSQESANPCFNTIHYASANLQEIDTDFAPARKADFLVLDTRNIASITVYKTLGKLITYTTVKVVERG